MPRKKSNLKSEARSHYNKCLKKVGTVPWDLILLKTNPKLSEELDEMAKEWHNHGETRDMFPKMAAFHRFVRSKIKGLGYQAFRRWLNEKGVSSNES